MKKKNILLSALLFFSLCTSACEVNVFLGGGTPSSNSNTASVESSSGDADQLSDKTFSNSGSNSSHSSSSSSSQQSSSSGNRSSSSGDHVVKAATVESVTFEVKENKAYLKVSGTEELMEEELMEEAEMKWAWGVRPYQDAAEGEELVWLLGSETPADADYKAVDAFDATAKTWSVSLCLADVPEIGGSLYTVYGGFKGSYAALELTDTTSKAKDSKNNYYVRDDNGASCIAVDVIPPVTLTKASVVANPDGKTGRYAKIGGEKGADVTQTVVDSWWVKQK